MSLFGISFFKNRAFIRAGKKPRLMHPMNAPTTMGMAPHDFATYKYVGPAIERVSSKDGRRQALVAQLVREVKSDKEAQVWEEMTASIRDVMINNHPQAQNIKEALIAYYATKISIDQQETYLDKSRPPVKGSKMYDSGTSLFTKLNAGGRFTRETF